MRRLDPQPLAHAAERRAGEVDNVTGLSLFSLPDLIADWRNANLLHKSDLRRLVGTKAGLDGNPGFAQTGRPGAGNPRIRIFQRDHDAASPVHGPADPREIGLQVDAELRLELLREGQTQPPNSAAGGDAPLADKYLKKQEFLEPQRRFAGVERRFSPAVREASRTRALSGTAGVR